MDDVRALAAAILPTAGVLFLFWLAFRAILRADRGERAALAAADLRQAAAESQSASMQRVSVDEVESSVETSRPDPGATSR